MNTQLLCRRSGPSAASFASRTKPMVSFVRSTSEFHLKSEHSRLKEQLYAAHVNEIKINEQVEILQRQLRDALVEKATIRVESEEFQSHIDMLQAALDGEKLRSGALIDQIKTLSNIESKCSQSNAQNDRLKSVLERVEKRAFDAERSMQMDSKKCSDMAEELAAKNSALSKIENKYDSLTSLQEDLMARYANLERNLVAVEKEHHSAQRKLKSISTAMKNLESTNKKLQQRIDELESSNTRLESELSLVRNGADEVDSSGSLLELPNKDCGHASLLDISEKKSQATTSTFVENNVAATRLDFQIEIPGFDLVNIQPQNIDADNSSHLQSSTYCECCSVHGKGNTTNINVLELKQQLFKDLERRKFIKREIQDLQGNIRVLCRVRPARNPSKRGNHLSYPGSSHGNGCSIVCKNATFSFDHVFQPSTSQADIYSQIAGAVEQVMDGRNVCIMAYGQTGSGKTHTMEGTASDPGVNIKALQHIFSIIDDRKDCDTTVKVSVLEFYMDEIRDLLSIDSGKRLAIQMCGADGVKSVHVVGLQAKTVTSTEEVLSLMHQAHRNRKTAETSMNAKSSRSHLVIQADVVCNSNSDHRKSSSCKLQLVDLAGSERVSKSQVSGNRLREARFINKSLSALGNVFAALENKSKHIPYRDSKLTQYLKDVLCEKSTTLMFVAISGDVSDCSESLSSLQFARRVAGVHLRKNADKKSTLILHELEKEHSSLNNSIEHITSELNNYKFKQK